MVDPAANSPIDDAILALPTPYYILRLLTWSDHLHFGCFRSERESLAEGQESFQYIDEVKGALEKVFALIESGGRLVIGDQFLNERRPREAVRFHFIDDVLKAAAAAGFRVATTCDISAGALPTTRRMLGELRQKAGDFVAADSKRRPEIQKDIDAMLYWGSQELRAFEGGLLSCRILVFDRPR